jgi:glycosidase
MDRRANKSTQPSLQTFSVPTSRAKCAFLDNHDKDRFFSVVGENVQKYKSAMAWLMTTRGIHNCTTGLKF